MNNKSIEILRLKDNLLLIEDKISIFDKKDEYVGNNNLVDFYNTIIKVDNLNNNWEFFKIQIYLKSTNILNTFLF